MPKLLDIDETQERILKEYIPGDTVYQQVEKDALPEICLQQVKEMCTKLYAAHTNIDYFPTNFILWQMSSIMWIMSAMPIWKNGILKTGESSTGLRQKNS